MKIISLISNVYQVVNEEETTVYYQGTKDDCQKWIDQTPKSQ